MIDFIVVASLFLTSCLFPFAGLCGILAWNVMGTRWSAHFHVTALGVPLYVTEAVMVGILLHEVVRAVRLPRPRGAGFWENKTDRFLWCGFYASGALSFFRGLIAFKSLDVFRDTAIVYYSLFAHLARRVVDAPHKLKILGLVLAYVTAVKIFLGLLIGYTGGAADSLNAATLIAVSFCTMPLWQGRYKWWFLVIALCFAEIVKFRVRSSWTGLFAMLLFYAAASAYLRMGAGHLKRAGLTLLAGLLLGLATSGGPLLESFGVFYSKFRTSYSTTAERKPLPSDQAPAESPGGPVETAGEEEFPSSENTQDGSSSWWTSKSRLILGEFGSFFAGLKSPNWATRLYFWLDVGEDVLGIRIPFFESHRKDLREMDLLFRKKLESNMGEIRLNSEVKRGLPHFLVNWRPVRALNGVPFGEKFVPPRLFWWMTTTRFDPHNSHVAIFHRLGLVGFFFYVALIAVVFKRGFAHLTSMQEGFPRYVMLGLLSGLVLHIVHSLTDVTLENSYKGALFWVLLGLTETVRRWTPRAPSSQGTPGKI